MSSVKSHGPLSGVAPPCPFSRACWAARASADSGRPLTSRGSVLRTANALVASSTLFPKLVESLASSCWISLKRSCRSPSSAPPESTESRICASTMRRWASESRAHCAPSARIALKASATARLCPIRSNTATTSGWTSSTAARSASESLTIFRCWTAPQALARGSWSLSSGSTRPSQLGRAPASSSARAASVSRTTSRIPSATTPAPIRS
mmetsp:Transcript_12993/g.31837  ORF Transcript_12993/g.31837 Transcript_12993/m.31837 type:complete len:210 (+) Transcript_12993:1640-2269(+)